MIYGNSPILLIFYLTYEEKVKQIKYENDKQELATQTQIFHFGQIPFHLFNSKHKNKKLNFSNLLKFVSHKADVKYFSKKRNKNLVGNPILKLKEIKIS